MKGRRFAGAPSGDASLGADVHATAQERSGRDDNRFGAKTPPLERLDAVGALAVHIHEETGDRSLYGMQSRLLLDK